MVRILVEGWRGISHSYALLSQKQMLEMTAMDDVSLFHRDLPFALGHWQALPGQSGFTDVQEQQLAAIPVPGDDDRIDAVYRVCSPFRIGASGPHADRPTLTFMITELGLAPTDFAAGDDCSAAFTRGANRIVTSSAWSRDRIVEYGFGPERIDIVPLGVDASVFAPMSYTDRHALRTVLGLAEDDVVFLNVGAPLWTKGTDLLLRAFGALKARGRSVRLLVKDQSNVYGVSLERMIGQVAATHPELCRPDVLAAITTIPQALSLQQLAALMNVADCYVSPYRAEGFNLPVLEAISCGVPVITTAGGATDAFCNDSVAWRIDGTFRRRDLADRAAQAFIEPDFEALLALLSTVTPRLSGSADEAVHHRQSVRERFGWRSSANRMVELARTAARC